MSAKDASEKNVFKAFERLDALLGGLLLTGARRLLIEGRLPTSPLTSHREPLMIQQRPALLGLRGLPPLPPTIAGSGRTRKSSKDRGLFGIGSNRWVYRRYFDPGCWAARVNNVSGITG